ncbi:dihydrolipoamide acetyltransferase family protein [Streptomyces carpaticus]|uniref:Dihydrolipoamide acetyltransferase component of pyruvate dehydrogenase complex n=1 Tax=Streptomyces carpaticus TaxID=285558 RepID=A0ABV4ZP26_9ACTN
MIDILMPRLSDTMEEGIISAWHKQPGDTVVPGDVLVDIETDKAIMEHEAYEAGTLAEILAAEGEHVAIGAPIARLDDGTGAPVTPQPQPQPRSEAAPPRDPGPRPPATGPDTGDTPAATAGTPTAPERRAATPLVRRLAHERGIDLSTVTGTGPGGRIVRADLDAAATAKAPATPVPADAGAPASAPPVAGEQDGRESVAEPFDAVRRAVATRLTESATTVPSFTVTASADVEDLLVLRGRLNASLDGPKITVNDLVVRAVALALREHPVVNASYSPEGRGHTLLHGRVHIGIAVSSPAGLLVPVVRDADRLAVTAISARARDLAERAAQRTLGTADMADGTFTISNLGMYGVEHFTAIINPPQGAILAVGAAREECAPAGETVVSRRRMRYTLTADHRIIDGAVAARFLATLTDLLEHPLRVLA